MLKSQTIYQSCTAGFGYSDAVCKLLGTKNATNETKRIEKQVQPYAASIFLTIKIVECIVPAFCGLFVGALADRYGRKPLLLASYLGEYGEAKWGTLLILVFQATHYSTCCPP